MYNSITFLLICFTLCYHASGQINLIINNSFEDTLNCPNGKNEVYNAPPWFNPAIPGTASGSSDYFNSCTTHPTTGIPCNTFGCQMPRTGNAYMGLGPYYSEWEAREYIEAPLKDSLLAGKKYCVSMYVSRGELPNAASWQGQGAIKELGAYFSTDSVTTSTWLHIPASPQIENSVFLTDSSGWTLISGEFTAQGGERFITIGNFRDDAGTSIMTMDTVPCAPGNHCSIYYYIDDVSVTYCDTCTSPQAAYTKISDGKKAFQFSNASIGANNNWYWDFGDGDTSSLENPFHNYDSAGYYTVKFISCNYYCCDTITQIVYAGNTGVSYPGGNNADFRIYPNPAQEHATLYYPVSQQATLSVYNMYGAQVVQIPLSPGRAVHEIDTDKLHPGVYYFTVSINENKLHIPQAGRLVVVH